MRFLVIPHSGSEVTAFKRPVAEWFYFRLPADSGVIELTANDPRSLTTSSKTAYHISFKCSRTGIFRFRCSFMTRCPFGFPS